MIVITILTKLSLLLFFITGQPCSAVCAFTQMHVCLVIPVIELLWSSPGVHFSFTLLLLWSDRTKFSGASGTSENHDGFIKSYTHTSVSTVRKGQGNKCSIKSSQELQDVERAESPSRLLLVSFRLWDVNNILEAWFADNLLLKLSHHLCLLTFCSLFERVTHRHSFGFSLATEKESAQMFTHLTPWAGLKLKLCPQEFVPHMYTHPGLCS